MRLGIFRRPSHATVVAYLALFLALAGSAAAVALKRNSVKSKQIAPGAVKVSDIGANAVNGAKVADDSLTGADVNESTLTLPAGSGDGSSTTPSTTIPSGTTIKGGWAIQGPSLTRVAINFRIPAPVELTDATVNFSNESPANTSDEDTSCTGTAANPTAPAGKVCIYFLGFGSSTADALAGFTLTNDALGEDVDRMGFSIRVASGGSANMGGTWAYTAP